MRRTSVLLLLGLLLALLVVPHAWIAATTLYGQELQHWSAARWDSARIAPDPDTTPEAVVQVYAARTWGWRGIFAVHSWIVMKPQHAPAYARYEVVGWGVWRGAPAVQRDRRAPDAYWAGNPPQLLLERRGDEAAALISRLEEAIANYPYPHVYRTWPGPNSNTFTAYLGRAVPELGLELPPTAIGKDFLGNGSIFARTPSGSGFQVSLLGVLGVSLGIEEGLEFNLLGCTIGVDVKGLALKLPGLGRIGLG